MFLLVAEGAGIYDSLSELTPESGLFYELVKQFHHHPWNGLRFWDLIQPYFMSIVGTAMYFSVEKRLSRGDLRKDITVHIVKRSIILLSLGVALHIGYNGRLVWELWNVLSQLSVTILIAYAIIKLPVRQQLFISFGLLVLSELLYRFTGIPGYDQPFIKDHNFGSYMDMILMGKINPGGGWVAINFLPTAAHTIWGVIAGKLLASNRTNPEKLKILLISGIGAVILGYAMDWIGFDPIIKRICTASFVIVSGGWFILTLAFFFWLIDIKQVHSWIKAFVIVGTNPIFIYMFMETAGKQWLTRFTSYFVVDFLTKIHVPEGVAGFVNAVFVLAFAWYLCYFLFVKKVFIKI